MTINIAYATTGDGYLSSTHPAYGNARIGGTYSATTGGNAGFYGQNNNAGQYTILEAFINFSFPAVAATDLVTAAYVRTWSAIQHNTSVARDLEYLGYVWTPGGLTSADWQDPIELDNNDLQAVVRNVQNSVSKFTLAGSVNLRNTITSGTSVELALVSSRQRIGNTPATDEGSAIITADEAGTTFDPALVWTTVPRSTIVPALTASVRTSGGHAELYSTGVAGGTATLRHYTDAGASWTATISGTEFELNPWGAQGFALAVDEADNLYVFGQAFSSPQSLGAKAFVKSVGAWSWTAATFRTVALPAYDMKVNNVSAAYHQTAGGTLVVATARTAGPGVSGTGGNEVAYALLSSAYLRTGTGTLTRATGSMLGTLLPALTPDDFNGWGNPTGTGLEVVADLSNQDWGYVTSFRKDQDFGQNMAVYVGRYILNASGTGFSHTSTQITTAYAVKDAAAKLRLVPCGVGQVALVSADSGLGNGLTVKILQAQGTASGLTTIGGYALAGQAANIPDGPAIASANYWDAVYSAVENSLWIYYRHASDSTKVMRTRFSLATYQATGEQVQVYSGLNVIGVRAPRNAQVTSTVRVQVATYAASTHALQEVVDTFNVAPTAPVLTPKANYDASAAGTFAWTPTDPNPGDTQSAYDFEVQRTDTNATVVTTGKTSSTTPSRNVTGGTLTNGLSYRWRVRTWDAADLVGPFSDWGTFSTSAGGTVTIIDPATNNPPNVVTDEVQVTWSVSGTTQSSYRVILKRNDTGATVSDTGWVTSTATAVLVTGMVTGVEHTIDVQVRNAALVPSGVGSRLVTANYGTPEVPLVQVLPVPDGGYVLVTVDNPLSGQPEVGTTINDMEAGITGWTAFDVTQAHSTEQAHSGTHSLKLTSTGTPLQAYSRYGSLPAPIVPTERYTARMWVYVPVERTVMASIDWAGPGWTYISTNAFGVTVPAGQWTEISVTGTAPDGADRCSFGPTLSGSPAPGSVLYVDDTVLVAASDRPAVDRNLILRRRAGSSDAWTVVGETDPDGSLRDYEAPAQIPLEYVARGVSD